MTPEVAQILFFVPAVLVAVGLGVYTQRRRRAFDDALRGVGERLGLRFVLGGWRSGYVSGELDDVEVCLDRHLVRHGKSSTWYTRVRTRHPALARVGLEITREGFASGLGKAIGLGDVEVGDPALDDVAVLRGERPATVLARMDPSTRVAVARAVLGGGTLKRGEWTLLRRGLDPDPEGLEALVRVVVGATRALALGSASAEALRARVLEDPVAEVRRRAAAEAVALDPPADWLAAAAASAEPVVALIAARASGEAGRARLRRLMGSPARAVAREAAVALAALPVGEDGPALEAALLDELAEEPTIEVADALGSVASVRAVVPLQAAAGTLARGPFARHAAAAVRAIQARAHGEAGALALADASGGELAEADERSRLGRLSRARAPEG